MEDPGLRVESREIIEAVCAREAERAYNRKHKCKFYYACAIAGIDGGIARVYHPEYVTYADMENLCRLPNPPEPTKEQIALKQARELIHGVVKDRLNTPRIITEDTIRGIVSALEPIISGIFNDVVPLTPGVSVEVIPDPENKSLLTVRITLREECR